MLKKSRKLIGDLSNAFPSERKRKHTVSRYHGRLSLARQLRFCAARGTMLRAGISRLSFVSRGVVDSATIDPQADLVARDCLTNVAASCVAIADGQSIFARRSVPQEGHSARSS